MLERFWERVDKDGPDGCWLWTGTIADNGYGYYGGTTAHRWMYRQCVGEFPVELHVDHLCRVRHCVNPAHLEPVTVRENTLRGIGFCAVNAGKTHCPRGHEFTEENTKWWRTSRRCRTCLRSEVARRTKKLREEREAALQQRRAAEVGRHSEFRWIRPHRRSRAVHSFYVGPGQEGEALCGARLQGLPYQYPSAADLPECVVCRKRLDDAEPLEQSA
jgi:hypothetical protein